MLRFFVGFWALLSVLIAGEGKADTFNVLGTFSNGALLTGSIGLNNGTLLFADLHGNNALPGDNAVNFVGVPICLQPSCAPGLTSYSYILSPQIVSEIYDPSTQTYTFHFNGGASTAYLDLIFRLLESGGVILGGAIFDPACGGPFCPPRVELTSGSLTPTPLPSSTSLFLIGLGLIALLSWRGKRSRSVLNPA